MTYWTQRLGSTYATKGLHQEDRFYQCKSGFMPNTTNWNGVGVPEQTKLLVRAFSSVGQSRRLDSVVELVGTLDQGSNAFGRESSSLSWITSILYIQCNNLKVAGSSPARPTSKWFNGGIGRRGRFKTYCFKRESSSLS